MAVVSVFSVGGAPGVTVSSLGLALSWPRPVLLVDDVVHSRWTMTTAARALRRAGAREVLPFALAVDG